LRAAGREVTPCPWMTGLKMRLPAAVDTTEVGAVKLMLWGARERLVGAPRVLVYMGEGAGAPVLSEEELQIVTLLLPGLDTFTLDEIESGDPLINFPPV
jgi:hypothetical protein